MLLIKQKHLLIKNYISLSRLIEHLLSKVVDKPYQSLKDFPIFRWVSMVANGRAIYQTKSYRRQQKEEFFNLKKWKFFLNANVLVSVLNKEYPTFSYSSRLLSLPQKLGKFEFYTSPICLAIAYYFAEKKSKSILAKKREVFVTIHLI